MAILWKIDPAHSEVEFKVRHLMITTVTGTFEKFDAEAETETEDFSTLKRVEFTADTGTVFTKNKDRDDHLRSADFFHAEEHPTLRFVSNDFQLSGDKGKLSGEMTIRGTTKPITLDVEIAGIVVDPYGQTKAGISLSGKLSRKEFGLTWDAVTEAGSVVVSDEVRLVAEVQMVKQS